MFIYLILITKTSVVGHFVTQTLDVVVVGFIN
jgi:hypothetical protein